MRSQRNALAGAASGVALGLWLFACASGKAAPEERATEHDASTDEPVLAGESISIFDDDEPRDGHWLYTRNCAGCHGETGDGRGETILQLGQTARSFAEGKFSFGNTRESILRTIASGIPGRSVMPGFKGILTEEERELVVDYVITLMPPGAVAEKARGTEMVVRERPVIARGKLPPVVEDAPEWPRGLLIGMPEGLTFEYRTDDVRLLAVRQGPFADRQDWNDRGGSYLEPLGTPIYVFGGGNPGPLETFGFYDDHSSSGFPSRLKSTWVRRDRAGLTYSVGDQGGVATVVETVAAHSLSVGSAFTRRFEITGVDDEGTLQVCIATSVGTSYAGQEHHPDEVSDGSWLTGVTADGVNECVYVRVPKGTSRWIQLDELWLDTPLHPRETSTIEVTIVKCADATPERLAQLEKEIER